LQTLLSALEDPDGDVRHNALSTLESRYTRLENRSGQAKRILVGLKRQKTSPYVPLDTHVAIEDLLNDLE
jgi:hypothetical protein